MGTGANDLLTDRALKNCPLCGSDERARAYGLDLQGPDLIWVPCCEGIREKVRAVGWLNTWGATLRNTALQHLGITPHTRKDDE